MSATEKVRAMLDERGIEWKYGSDSHTRRTRWCIDSIAYEAIEVCDRLKVTAYYQTPEQVIAALLGRTRTCKEVKIYSHYRGCSECGYIWEHMYAVGWQVGPKFCPMCGAKVVGE